MAEKKPIKELEANFFEDFLEIVEDFPGDIQRELTLFRANDLLVHQIFLRNLETATKLFEDAQTVPEQRKYLSQLEQSLNLVRQAGDDKMCASQRVVDLVEAAHERLNASYDELRYAVHYENQTTVKMENKPVLSEIKVENANLNNLRKRSASSPLTSRRSGSVGKAVNSSRAIPDENKGKASVKKKTKVVSHNENVEGETDDPPSRNETKSTTSDTPSTKSPSGVNDEVDDSQLTYCLCNEEFHGEMVGCDNELCDIEWYHFECVKLKSKPKGNWYCPTCRLGDMSHLSKSRAQLAKEKERRSRRNGGKK